NKETGAAVTLAAEADRAAPPAPGKPVSARIPTTEEKTLGNGLRVIVATNRALPLISANLRFASGASSDPADLAGLADMTASLATKGTRTRSATDIAQQIERLGASLGAGADADSTAVSLFTRADRRDEAFELFADVTRNPIFAAEELKRAQQQAVDELSVALGNPGQVAARVMTRVLYGASPYGGVATERSLEAIKSETAADHHLKYWRPENGVLVLAGDISAAEGFALAEKHFGGWKPAPNPLAAATMPAPPPPPSAPRVLVVDFPGSGQAAVAFGLRTLERTHKDYFPTLVATTVLGGGYSARLNTEIRIKRGLSYGAGASLPSRRAAAPVVARTQTKNESATLVADLIGKEFARLGAEDAPQGELAARKATLIGGFGRDVETISGLAGDLSTFALYGLPSSSLARYTSDIEQVDAAAARAAARAYLAPERASIVVVGDAKTFWTDFKKAHPTAQRLSIKKLDLDKPTLD
ncbi:MAG: insulinase family protein, partial [Parvularculaceae bacterium]|nr:insulinase family protein [Parvularculaceae bacterium]